MRVLVTGAGGKTGRLVVRRLLQYGIESFVTRALVRSAESEAELRRYLGRLSVMLEVVHGDIRRRATIEYAFRGIDVVIVLTGAKPQVNSLSLAGVYALKVASLGLSEAQLSFDFAYGQTPNEIDWIGQKNQVDAAKASGASHVVLVSTMAGRNPEHELNAQMGEMALYKRKAEHYLRDSGLPYTIIHAARLLPEAGDATPALGARRQLFIGVDDTLLDERWEHNCLVREDLARVCVDCVQEPLAVGRSFDLGSGPEHAGEIYNGNLAALLANLQGMNCTYEEHAWSPRFIPKIGMAQKLINKLSKPPECNNPKCGPCRVPEDCQNGQGLKAMRRRDNMDAEAPGMRLIFDERALSRPRGQPERSQSPYHYDDADSLLGT